MYHCVLTTPIHKKILTWNMAVCRKILHYLSRSINRWSTSCPDSLTISRNLFVGPEALESNPAPAGQYNGASYKKGLNIASSHS